MYRLPVASRCPFASPATKKIFEKTGTEMAPPPTPKSSCKKPDQRACDGKARPVYTSVAGIAEDFHVQRFGRRWRVSLIPRNAPLSAPNASFVGAVMASAANRNGCPNVCGVAPTRAQILGETRNANYRAGPSRSGCRSHLPPVLEHIRPPPSCSAISEDRHVSRNA